MSGLRTLPGGYSAGPNSDTSTGSHGSLRISPPGGRIAVDCGDGAGTAGRLQIGTAVVDRADERVPLRRPAVRIDSGVAPCLKSVSSKMIISPGFSCCRRTGWRLYLAVVRDIGRGVKVCFRAFADPVEYVNDDKLLVVVMRFRYDIGECAEEVHAECAFGLSAGGRHQWQEGPMRSRAWGSSRSSTRACSRRPAMPARSVIVIASCRCRLRRSSSHW